MKRSAAGYFFIEVIVICILSASCRQQESIPLPAGESVYAQPIARPLKWGAAESINWEPPNTENLQPPVVKRVDLSKIPSRPVNAGSFQPLPQPLIEKKFNWDNLADTALNWNTLPELPLETDIYVLPEPEPIPVSSPKIRPDELTGITYLGLNEGLPTAKIDDITQDAYGIIWFINEGKLFRYDGAVVQKYSLQGDPVLIRVMRDQQGLIWLGADNQDGLFVLNVKSRIQWHVKLPASVSVVHEDANGQYWAGTFGKGVFILDWQKKTSKQLLLADEVNAFNAGNTVLDFYDDKKGQAWMATGTGIKIINASRNKISSITAKDGLHSNIIWKITADSKGRLWLGARDYPGISILYPDEGRIQYAGPASGLEKFIINPLEAPDHNIYLPSDSIVYVLDPALQVMKSIGTSSNYKSRTWYAHSIIDKSGQLWIGSVNNGLQLIDTRGILPVHLDKSKGLGGNAIYGLMEDHSKQLWMGIGWTYPEKTGKVNRLDIPGNRISDFTPVLDTPIVNMYTSMEDHKQRIWLGLYGKGIYVLDFAANTVTAIGKAQGLMPWGSAIFEDSRRQVWLGQANGIVLMDSSLQILQQFNEIIQGKESTVVSIQEDNKQQVWIATTGNGIYRIDSSRTFIQHFGVDDGLAGPEVNGLKLDNSGRPWIATNKGVTILDDKLQQYYNLSTGHGLISPATFSVLNVHGKMAISTAKGLATFTESVTTSDTNKSLLLTARSYDRNQGLAYADFNAGSGAALQEGKMAFGVDLKVLSIFNLPVEDAVSSPVYLTAILLDGKPVITSDNQSLVSQLNDKDSLRDEANGALYTISKLPADTEYYSRKDIKWKGLTGPYNLPAGLKLRSFQNYLQFQFAGMHYRDRDKLRYRYILEGVDHKWSDFTDKQLTEPYRDLAPGNYIFRVAALTTSGQWSQSDPYAFTILPPWWKTSWAFIVYGILVIAAISALVRFRSRQLKRKNILLEEKIRLRTHELQESIATLKNTQSQLIQAEKMASLGELTAGIAHEIKNPLNFVNNFAEINKELLEEMNSEIEKGNYDEVKNLAIDVIDNAEKIIHHGKRADDIVKGMLQHSRSSVGVKEPTAINTLADEYLRLAYHGLRAKEKSFHANLETDFDPELGSIQVIPQDIGRVILNLITNAFYAVNEKRHETTANYEPTVTVSTRKIGQLAELRVSDNGNGIPLKVMDKIFQPFFTTKPTGQGTGLGLSLSYDIVKAHGGDLKVETREGLGATFIIQLPLS